MNEECATTTATSKSIILTFVTFLLLSAGFKAFSATIYIDPSYTGSTQNGSITNPYNSWTKVSFASGNTYLQKNGTTYTTSGAISISSKSGITLGSYGSGAKAKIIASGSGNHIINVSSSSGIVIKDLEIASSNSSWISGIILQGTNASNNEVNNCLIHNAEWGIRILTTASGNKILNSTVHTTGDDGIYVKDAASIEIGFCNIYNVNTKYLINPDQSYSSGDGIQIASTNNMNLNIHDNTIDHSSMGNKFCIIAWGDNYSGVIENNVLIGSIAKVVSAIYLSPTTKTVTVRYNTIKNSNYGIYSYANQLDAYYNRFSENKVAVNVLPGYSLNARNNVFYLNTTNGVAGTSNSSITLKNNIFYINSGQKAFSSSGSITSNNNLFNQESSGFINGQSTLSAWRNASGNDGASLVSNPQFISPSNGDFHIQGTSMAVNKGANVNLSRDFFGSSVPQSGTPDIGLHEVTGGQSSGNQSPVIGNQSFTAAQSLPVGSFVGKVVASDPDPGQTLTYSIVSGNTNSTFAINASTGNITVAKALPLQLFNLTVKVTDNGSPALSAQATVSIQVTASSGNQPPYLPVSTFSVIKFAPVGTFVGKLTATDPNQGQTLTYTIVSGNTNNAFTLNAYNGALNVKTSSALNPTVTPKFYLKVKVTDNGQPNMSFTQTIIVNVVNSKSANDLADEGDSNTEDQKEMLVYPNPSRDGNFSVAFGKTYPNVKLEVYDLSGKMIKSMTVTESSKESIDLGTNPPGTYLIRLDAGSEVKTLKAVKN